VAPLLAGVPVYFARGFAPREIVADLERSGATFLLGVPLLFEKISSGIDRGLRAAGVKGQVVRVLWSVSRKGRPFWKHKLGKLALGSVRAQAGLGRMRYLVSGGAPLSPEVGKRFEALGVKLLQGYGLTETSPVVTLNLPSEANPASVGKPLPGVEVRIHEPSELGDGEVRVRGATVMRGYWDDEEATRNAVRDGWFCTGDLGRFDRRGHLHITGRLKNLIVSPGGKNISPEEIEGAAQKCPAVAEILVFGRHTDQGSGEEVCARVFPDLDFARAQGWPVESCPELLSRVRAQIEEATADLAPYKKIVHYELVMEPFEKTTTHKIKRFKHSPPPARP
jgi:long-chain acyl-CoA synthetase